MKSTKQEIISLSIYVRYVCISILVFFSLCHFFHFYYETGSESHFKIITSGVFSGNPQGIFNSFGTHILIDKWMAFFYRLFPAINWYDTFICFLHGILLGHLILLLRIIVHGTSKFVYVIAMAVFVFLCQNFIQQDPLRLSILLTMSSMVFLLNIKLAIPLKLWMLFMFFLGILVRVESGVLAVVFVTITEVFYKGYRKAMFKEISIFYFILFLILAFINQPLNEEEREYLKIRPYQFALWDYYSEFPDVRFESAKDSVIFYSADRAFMADETKINADFFKKVGLKSTDKTPEDIMNYIVKIPFQLNRGMLYFKEFVFQQKILWLIILSSVAVIVLLFKRTMPTLLITIITLTTLVAISILMKMEMRLLYSMLSMLIVLAFFYSKISSNNQRPDIPIGWSMFVFIIAFLNMFLSTSQYTEEKSEISEAMYLAKQELMKLPKSAIVFLDLATTIHWYNYMFEKEISLKCQIIPVDNGLIYLTKGQQNKLKSIFGCFDFPCYMNKFLHRENSYFLAVPERKKILENYMNVVYQTPIDFSELKKIELENNPYFPSLSLYSIVTYRSGNSKVSEF